MKVCEIADIIEKIAPTTLAEEWDNVGLLVGDKNDEVKGVVIALDLTNSVIDKCLHNNCNLIITHHPVIFKPINEVTTDTFKGDLIVKCLQNKINVYSAHTNMDIADEGINFAFADKLDIKAKRFLDDGLGVFGEFKGDLDELILKVCKITNEKQPKIYRVNNVEKLQKHNIAFISGSGGGMSETVEKLKEHKITTYISSEFKHSLLLEILSQNVNVIQIGHFESEIIFVEIIYKLLESKVSNLQKYVDFI